MAYDAKRGMAAMNGASCGNCGVGKLRPLGLGTAAMGVAGTEVTLSTTVQEDFRAKRLVLGEVVSGAAAATSRRVTSIKIGTEEYLLGNDGAGFDTFVADATIYCEFGEEYCAYAGQTVQVTITIDTAPGAGTDRIYDGTVWGEPLKRHC